MESGIFGEHSLSKNWQRKLEGLLRRSLILSRRNILVESGKAS